LNIVVSKIEEFHCKILTIHFASVIFTALSSCHSTTNEKGFRRSKFEERERKTG